MKYNESIVLLLAAAIGASAFIAISIGKAKADDIDWQYKAPCNPMTTSQTNDVVPGYYYNVTGQCVYGDVNRLSEPTPHEYSPYGMLFYNGYNPTPPVPNYYNNQSFSSTTHDRH
jgi:hypothetical protein